MKILLLGEYSRLHNSLKEGLTKLGHEVFLAGYADYFKNYPVDFKFELKYEYGLKSLLKRLFYKLFNLDLHSRDIYTQFCNNQHFFKGYDVVQLINEHTFKTVPNTELKILNILFRNNKKVFLLSCGTDYPSVDFAYKKRLKYSILTPLEENNVSKKKYLSVLKYLRNDYIELHKFIYKNIEGVIASDLDYHLPLINNSKYLGLIPNPVNTDTLKYGLNENFSKIIIFHGINKQSYYKKGNYLFEEALKLIKLKFNDQIEILSETNLPYSEYISSYEDAHIVLDQVYSYDQGYNALEAMAKGKVVFTGAEKEWQEYYQVKTDTIAINAEPNVMQIVCKLEWLITNPERIKAISLNARNFIEKHHNYIITAQSYIDCWQKSRLV